MYRRLFVAAILIIASTLLSSAMAQTPPGAGPPAGGSDSNLRNQTDSVRGRSNEMERARRDMEKPDANSSADSKFPEIKDDFERIQLLNSNDLQPVASVPTPDYKRIAEVASEIKKRAARLKSNLFPVEPEKQSKEKSKETEEQQELKSLLSALDKAIASFVSSPIFQNTQVVNPQDSVKANQDLNEVIKISTRIKKEADKMKKTGGD